MYARTCVAPDPVHNNNNNNNNNNSSTEISCGQIESNRIESQRIDGRPTRITQTGSVLVEIEEPPPAAAAADDDDAGASGPTQAFLSSADKAGVPELSIPRSPRPAADAAAVASVPASASAALNGESGARGLERGRTARRQVSDDHLERGGSPLVQRYKVTRSRRCFDLGFLVWPLLARSLDACEYVCTLDDPSLLCPR